MTPRAAGWSYFVGATDKFRHEADGQGDWEDVVAWVVPVERGEGVGGDIWSCHVPRANRFTPAQASGLGWAREERSSIC